ncbi:ABC transporter substrate-binding protein [Desulfoplanes sp. PS50]
MKNRIYISVPVNISRNIIIGVRNLCPEAEVFSSSRKFYADDLVYLDHIRAGKMDKVPEVFVSIHHGVFEEGEMLRSCGHFDTKFRYPVSRFIFSTGLVDESWLIKPVYIMPLIIFYNTSLNNPPRSWSELMEERFRGRILCTDEKTPPAVLLKNVYRDHFQGRGRTFVEEDVHYRGLPIDVNMAVGKGEYDIGVMPVSFARFSRNNRAAFIWPEEGAIPLMQMMIMKKGCDDECRRAAEYLLSPGVQEVFSRQAGFVPVSPATALPDVFEASGKKLWVPYSLPTGSV